MRNVNELIFDSIRKFGEKKAVEDGKNFLTYRKLGDISGAVGTFLSKEFFRKPVIVMCDRNIESFVMILGVVLSGIDIPNKACQNRQDVI